MGIKTYSQLTARMNETREVKQMLLHTFGIGIDRHGMINYNNEVMHDHLSAIKKEKNYVFKEN